MEGYKSAFHKHLQVHVYCSSFHNDQDLDYRVSLDVHQQISEVIYIYQLYTLLYIHAYVTEFCSVIKTAIMSFAGRMNGLETIILRDIGQTQKGKYYIFFHV